jgi:hypothetical protein
MELKRQLELLRDIWALFENVKEAAKAWEGTEREKRWKAKRKREENDTNTCSLTTRCTTRSQSRSANGGHDGPPSPSQSGSCACTQPGGSDMHKRSTRVANKRKRKLGSSSLSGATLTETAMQHLSKRQKIADSNTMVMQWVESTGG